MNDAESKDRSWGINFVVNDIRNDLAEMKKSLRQSEERMNKMMLSSQEMRHKIEMIEQALNLDGEKQRHRSQRFWSVVLAALAAFFSTAAAYFSGIFDKP